MSFSPAMAGRGGGYDGQTMNVASSLPVILSRADGEGPRKHIVTVRSVNTGPTADVRSLSVLRRIRMTAVHGDRVNGCTN
jgi:hypothetical protein